MPLNKETKPNISFKTKQEPSKVCIETKLIFFLNENTFDKFFLNLWTNWFHFVSLFNGISAFVGYLMPKTHFWK